MIFAILAAAVTCVRVPTPSTIVPWRGPSFMEACEVVPVGWRPMATAPRDGTIIEIRNAFGTLPTYSINRWGASLGDSRWIDAKPQPPCKNPPPVTVRDRHGKTTGMQFSFVCGVSFGFTADAEPGLAWRPYTGDPALYRDHNPTMAEWRAAR